MWIESMNSFEIQCNTEGLQIDKAGINIKIQLQKNKTNDFYMKTGMTLASRKMSLIYALDILMKFCRF